MLKRLPRTIKNILCYCGLHVDKNHLGPLDYPIDGMKYQDWCYWCGWREMKSN